MKIKNLGKFKTDITNALMAGLPYDYCVERTTIGKTTEFCLKADDCECNYYIVDGDDFKCVALYDVIKVTYRKAFTKQAKSMFVSIINDDSIVYIDEGDKFNPIDVKADFDYYENRFEYIVSLTVDIINFFNEV